MRRQPPSGPPGEVVLKNVQFVGRSSVSSDSRRFLHDEAIALHNIAQTPIHPGLFSKEFAALEYPPVLFCTNSASEVF